MKDHVIICGLGRNGAEAAKELIALKIPFIVIEHNNAAIEEFREINPGPIVLQGDATSEDLLIRAHVEQARGIIAALSDDALNVFVTLTARELNPKIFIVARASHESTITKLRRSGVNRVILPNMIAGRRMARVMAKPSLIDFVDLITGEGAFNLHLEEADCGPETGFVGKSLRELNVKVETGVLVLGAQSVDGKFELNPPSDRVITEGEKLFILGTTEQLGIFRKKFGGI